MVGQCVNPCFVTYFTFMTGLATVQDLVLLCDIRIHNRVDHWARPFAYITFLTRLPNVPNLELFEMFCYLRYIHGKAVHYARPCVF